MKHSNLHYILIFVVVALFYADTLTLNYALDDRMVIMESQPVLKGGWQGVKDIFTKDTFSGYFGTDKSLVAGGRYRPMSQFTFLIEVQLFGKNAVKQIGNLDDFANLHSAQNEQYFADSPVTFVSHLFNILYFALLCMLIYAVLVKLFGKYQGEKWYQSLPLLAVILFAIHPIHTEAVANVKGRDEIFAMMGAMATLWCSLQFVDKRKWFYLVLSFVAMSFALFSKENAITFLAVVPLSLFFYSSDNQRKMDYLWTILPLMAASVFFIAARSVVLGGLMPNDTTHNVLNNPFINTSKANEIATVLLTWGIYLRLLVFPHPLTHDYYPWQMEISSFANPFVWLIVVACIVLLVFALRGVKKKSIFSYATLFFVITFSITSNLLFNLGTFMNERFVFIPSLGFTLLLGYGFYQLLNSRQNFLQKLSMGVFLMLFLLCGVKTISRNLVWKDDFTLFLTDVKTSNNSIKCNISAGGSCYQIWRKSHKDRDKKNAYMYLNKALSLDPNALNAHLLMGDLMFYDEDYTGSYEHYRMASLIDPSNAIAQKNMEIAHNQMLANEYEEATKMVNEGRAMEALAYINQKIAENPNSLVALNVKGNVLGRGLARYDEAIAIYKQIIAQDSTFASAWENMGIAYAISGRVEQAESCLLKAHELLPDNQNIISNLQILYKQMGQPNKQIP